MGRFGMPDVARGSPVDNLDYSVDFRSFIARIWQYLQKYRGQQDTAGGDWSKEKWQSSEIALSQKVYGCVFLFNGENRFKSISFH